MLTGDMPGSRGGHYRKAVANEQRGQIGRTILAREWWDELSARSRLILPSIQPTNFQFCLPCTLRSPTNLVIFPVLRQKTLVLCSRTLVWPKAQVFLIRGLRWLVYWARGRLCGLFYRGRGVLPRLHVRLIYVLIGPREPVREVNLVAM